MRHESDWPAERQAGEADILFLAERRSHAGLSPFDDCEAVEPFVLIEGAGHDLEPLGQSLNPCRSLADLILSPGERLTAACASEHRVGWISPPGSIQLLGAWLLPITSFARPTAVSAYVMFCHHQGGLGSLPACAKAATTAKAGKTMSGLSHWQTNPALILIEGIIPGQAVWGVRGSNPEPTD